MNPEKTSVIYGPPGTGKTTELIRAVGALLESSLAPEEICYVAFTRKAAHEALERVSHALKLPPVRFPFFKTLHALAFHQLGLDSATVMGFKDYYAICNKLGLSITGKGLSEDGTFQGYTKGDRLFFMENMSRTMGLSLKEYWEGLPNEDVYYYELEQLRDTVRNYKEKHDKVDFTDIIERFVKNPTPPACSWLFVDEAQDLSPLQWKMVDALAENVEKVVIAGDDDQSIFKWAGAATDTFIALAGSRRVLHQSYRVPAQVQSVAESIVSRITHRVLKDWRARPASGQVDRVNEVTELDMMTGTWLLLARNSYLLDYYVQHCIREGYVFDAPNSPIRGAAFAAIKLWEDLRKGEGITVEQATILYEMMGVRTGIQYGFKGKIKTVDKKKKLTIADLQSGHGLLKSAVHTWDIALDRITDEEREYFLSALRRGEKFLAKPRIKISTIHSIKGGEADNVVVQVDMAGRTWKEYEQSPDDEHRVWYVAVTRAKEKLVLLSPKTNQFYTI